MRDPTERFSDRVSNYVKYRPHYPEAIVRLLERKIGLSADWVVADVGSGTGISSERFLERGCRVYCVEPNREMRAAAEASYGGMRNFISLSGRAEATGIEAESIDLYVSGQAFHWFDRPAARAEALRILRKPRHALIMWNDWARDDSPFLGDYDAFLRAWMPDRTENDHRNLGPQDIDAFFGGPRWEKLVFKAPQVVDLEGLKGRLLSASYAPKEGDPDFEPAMAELEKIFERHATRGDTCSTLEFGYTTVLYLGTIR